MKTTGRSGVPIKSTCPNYKPTGIKFYSFTDEQRATIVACMEKVLQACQEEDVQDPEKDALEHRIKKIIKMIYK